MAGYTVDSLSSLCFYKNPNVVTINLGNYPYAGNTMYKAFYQCYSLSNVTNINENVTNMTYTFFSCRNLFVSPVIPNNVSVMTSTFTNCQNLITAPIIPNSVTIMANTFTNCVNLVDSPIIPDGVTNMYGTFTNCTKLQNVPTIPSTVISLTNTFVNSGIVTAPVIPDTVEHMDYTFYYCKNLVNVPNFPNSCKSMLCTFQSCNSLSQIPNKIPDSVISMTRAFDSCSNLTQAPELSNNVKTLSFCFSGCYKLTQAPALPNSVEEMSYCFSSCSNLSQAPIIPPNVINIDSAFANTNISTTPIINHLTNIYNGIWGGCNSLFRNCVNLSAISSSVPSGVRNVSYICQNCPKVTDAMVKTLLSELTTNETVNMERAFMNCANIVNPNLAGLNAHFVMPYAFAKCGKLTGCTLPPNSVNICYAFQDCVNLTSMPTIPSTATEISGLCSGCTKLTTAPIIPANVVNMSFAFSGCVNLTGNINILSANINWATDCFGLDFYNSGKRKNVYIPFKYANGVNTMTYNAMIWCGYTTNGSECNVYLMDNNLRPES